MAAKIRNFLRNTFVATDTFFGAPADVLDA